MVDMTNITATFGPVRGDRTTLSKSCRTTIDAIYQHPISHSLEWPDVIALFAKIGTVEHKTNNDFVFAIGGERHLMRKAHGGNLPADDVVEFRHMLTRAGWSPETAPSPSAPVTLHAQTAAGPDLLVTVTHREARLYELDVRAAEEATHTIGPFDPHHFLHHLSHKDQSDERGQRATEDQSFYVRIAEALRPAGRIAVIGHGDGQSNAAQHLIDYLRQQHQDIFQKSRPAVDADLSSLTVPELLALGRHSLSTPAGIETVE
jgi:hypothetical protein